MQPLAIQVGPFLFDHQYIGWANESEEGAFQTSHASTEEARNTGRWLQTQQWIEYGLGMASRVTYAPESTER